uniref:Uncharacterized protein n=1 Tax=Caenorhabditis japonica TaxID=281687 RepID=A0A8R1E468_CAEJA
MQLKTAAILVVSGATVYVIWRYYKGLNDGESKGQAKDQKNEESSSMSNSKIGTKSRKGGAAVRRRNRTRKALNESSTTDSSAPSAPSK